MSNFEDFASAHAAAFVEFMGERNGVEIVAASGKKKLDAVVGAIRVESEQVIVGTSERTSHREVCQIVLLCPPGTVGVSSKLFVEKYIAASQPRENQAFYVQSIERETDSATTLQAWRESLSKLQRRGTETGS